MSTENYKDIVPADENNSGWKRREFLRLVGGSLLRPFNFPALEAIGTTLAAAGQQLEAKIIADLVTKATERVISKAASESLEPEIQSDWTTEFDWNSEEGRTLTSQGLTKLLDTYIAHVDPPNLENKYSGFGHYLNLMRKLANRTRVGQARECNVHPLAYLLIEQGVLPRADVTRQLLDRISKGLGISNADELAINPFEMQP